MGSPWDVAFGRLAVQQRLVAQEAVRVAYSQLPPGRTLKDELIARRLLAPDRAQALEAMLRAHAGPPADDGATMVRHAPAPAADDSATMMRPAPTASSGDDAPTMVRPGPASSGAHRASASAAGAPQLPEVGSVVAGRYELKGLLGKGGMGAVFRAQDTQTGELHALKVLLPGADPDGTVLARFRREAEAVAKVDAHAGIVRVRSLGEHQGLPYVVMDLVVGDDLHELVKDGGPLEVERALRYTEAIARAVQHCHDKGVLHRDLKPANVLLRAHDDAPLVMDFGLALHGDGDRLTKTGEVMGTPAFMSPEQADGDKAEIDHRTDVYALGGVLYELVTGNAPFVGEPIQILAQVFRDLPKPIATVRPDAPADLDVIIRKAMAKDKALRYASARDLADDVGRLARGEPITARPPTAREEREWRARRGDIGARLQLRRRRFGAILAATAAVLLGAWLRELWLDGQLPAALSAVPAALLQDGPLEPGAATEEVVKRLLGHSPPGEDAVARIDALAGLGANPLPGFERAGDALRADPAALRALRTLARRLALSRGQVLPFPLPADATAEERLMRALALLSWGRDLSLEQVVDAPAAPIEEPRALLSVAALDEGKVGAAARQVLTDLDAIEQQVRARLRDDGRKLAMNVKAALADPRAKVVSTYPDTFSAGRVELAPFAHVVFIREKPVAVAAAIASINSIVHDDHPRGWSKERHRYAAIVAAVDVLRPFVERRPSVRADPALVRSAQALLATVGGRTFTATAEPPCLYEFGRLLRASQGCFDLQSDELRRRTTDAVYLSFRSYLERNERPPLESVMTLPALHQLPTARGGFEPFFRSAVEDREIDTFVKEHKTADGYLVWAELLGSIRGYDDHNDVKLMTTIREKYAAALGEHLDAAARARLSVGPPEELWVSLTPYFVPYAQARAAVLTVRIERASGSLRRPVIDAALELLRDLRRAAPDDDPVHARRLARLEAGCLSELLSLVDVDSTWKAALQAQHEEALTAEMELGWLIARGVVKGERRDGYEEGSMGAADARLDEDHLASFLEGPIRDLAQVLENSGRAAAALDLVTRSIARYQALGGSLPFPYHLLRAQARLCLKAGDLAGATTAARASLQEARQRPGADPKSREKVAGHRSEARAYLARVLLHQGDTAGARAQLEDARRDGDPIEGGSWGPLLQELGDR